MVNRDTLVFTTRERLVLDDDIVLPKGVQLIHDSSFSEGFESLCLFVNVQSSDVDKYFSSRTESGSAFLSIPYWLRE